MSSKDPKELKELKEARRVSMPILPPNYDALRIRAGSIPPKVPLEQIQSQENLNAIPVASPSSSWFDLTTFDWDILIPATALKLLLFPTYRSTDFEVHRNWMAITNSLPISKWYIEATSEWTLDYPPFFAYFEYLLSIPASFIDAQMVNLQNLGYSAPSVIAYQRTTVIVTELVLAFALKSFIKGSVNPQMQRIISASLFLHPGFLIVDHIHFQYNGFLFGILLWSILMARNGKLLLSGILFAVLLNFKHIYMYIAPAYFVYLLRAYCMTPSGITYSNYAESESPLIDILLGAIQVGNFIQLALGVLTVFLASFGPWVIMGQIPVVFRRLFPFTRGLNHAYWAPNAWALVTAADRLLLQLAKFGKLKVDVNQMGVESSSRGLVGDTVFAVLPNVEPKHTFAITIILQVCFLIKLWRNPTYKSFVTALTLCGYISFLFGWHVHEKAILLVLVPLSLLAAERYAYFRTFVLASVAGIFSLFPLLFTPAETLIKIVYTMGWCLLVLLPISKQLYTFPTNPLEVIVDFLERAYLYGFILIQTITTFFPEIMRLVFLKDKDRAQHAATQYEFLPLLITSVYCAVGVVWAFIRLSALYIREKY